MSLKRYLLASALSLSACSPALASPTFSISDVTVREDAGNATLTISKSGTSGTYSTLWVNTSDTGQTAKANVDFKPFSYSLTFQKADTSKTVTVPIINRTGVQPTRSFLVKIAPQRSATIGHSPAIVTITDKDVAPIPPASDTPALVPEPWGSMAKVTCPSWQIRLDLPGLVCDPRPAPPPLSMNGVSFMGEATIPDNFDPVKTWGVVVTPYPNPATGLLWGGVPSDSHGEGGNFRMNCLPGHLAKDDPLIKAGQPGMAHIHQFFGNTLTNAFSTYESLRTTGQSTCQNPLNGPVNRTAYWLPAMLDGVGNVVKPDEMSAYYKQWPSTAPACTESGQCVPLPNGLRYAFGYDGATGLGGITDPSTPVYSMVKWTCNKDEAGNAAIPGSFRTLDDMADAGCPAGSKLFLMFVAPDCWNGVTDAPDHRSNMSYPTRATANGFRCPLDHPYWTPNYSGFIVYTADANFVAKKWHFSSDEMTTGWPNIKGGTTVHFDYWEAWSPEVKATWFKFCIEGSLSCSGGDLGNGTNMNVDDMGPRPAHQLVPVSSIQ